jgi:hypothetical protein
MAWLVSFDLTFNSAISAASTRAVGVNALDGLLAGVAPALWPTPVSRQKSIAIHTPPSRTVNVNLNVAGKSVPVQASSPNADQLLRLLQDAQTDAGG